MKKKTIIIFAIFLVILVGIGCILQYRYTHRSIKSFAAAMCTIEGITVKDSVSYLEVQFDDEGHTVKKIAVKNENVLKKISESNIQEIIGVNIASDIPKKVLEENHLSTNINDFNSLQLLMETDKYDDFFEVVDVSFSEKQSFVGKVIEETTAYMIVEPAEDEYEKNLTQRMMVKYDTDHVDFLYGTGRLVVIYYDADSMIKGGAMPIIESAEISTEGFREWELKVTPTKLDSHKILAVPKAAPHDSDSASHWYKQYNLYYYDLDEVMVSVDGNEYPLAHAIKIGKVSMSAILAKANRDVADGVIDELVYKDGGSQVYKYPDYTIVKYHTLDGNDDMYIGTPDMDIHVKDK